MRGLGTSGKPCPTQFFVGHNDSARLGSRALRKSLKTSDPWMQDIQGPLLLGLDSDTFYIYHVAAVMVDNLRRLLLGINLSDKAIMDFDFPGVGFPV